MTDERAMTTLMVQSLDAQNAYNAELGNACIALSDLVFMLYQLRIGNMTTKPHVQGFVAAFGVQTAKFVDAITRAAVLLYEAQTLAALALAEIERDESNAYTDR